jgi:hypothetical protein
MADDILVLGLSKTGTTAISQAIWRSLGSRHRLLQEPTTFGQPGGESVQWHGQQCAGKGVLAKCLVFPELAEDAWEQVAAVADHYRYKVWIDRDPRDRLISNTFYGWYRGHGRRIPSRSRRQFWEQQFQRTLAQVERKERDPAAVNFTDFLSGWWEPGYLQRFGAKQRDLYERVCAARQAQLAGWFVVRYEDFIDGELGDLSTYLGAAIDHRVTVKLRQKRVARTRGYGGWRDWFTAEDVQRLQPVYREYLAQAGYDAQDWALNHPAALDASVGSRYMKKIHGQLAF